MYVEVRADHQQGVAALHRFLGGRGTEKPDPPEHERIAVGYRCLAGKGLDDGTAEKVRNA